MAEEFKPIETQEQFNALLKSRLERKERSIQERFEGYMSPETYAEKEAEFTARIKELEEQLSGKDTKISELESKYDADIDAKVTDLNKKLLETESKNASNVAMIMRMKASISKGIPVESADFMSGTTPEEIDAEAERIKKIFEGYKKDDFVVPMANLDQISGDGEKEAYRKLLRSMKGDI